MHWNPGRKAVAVKPAVKPSRIRREPVRLTGEPEAVAQRKLEPPSREVELWGGIVGILLFAAALTIVIVGIAAANWFNDDPAADAEARHFGQCYNAFGPNCVLDGGTARIAGETVTIAGLEAPRITDAACDNEHAQGIDAAMKLAGLLNSGSVTVGSAFRDEEGRVVRTVAVGGNDVAKPMIAAGVARSLGSKARGWCSSSSADL
jgi:endonuclease YncB( thermonuclease family)